MAEKEVNITYETLFELLRREKNREELQQLQDSFFKDVIAYVNEKKAILEKPEADDNVFASQEKDKAVTQVNNIRKIIKEFYERRERKLMEMALFKSRTGSKLINTSSMLAEEKKLFEELVKVLDAFRAAVINNVVEGKEPVEAVLAGGIVPGTVEDRLQGKLEKPKIQRHEITVKFTSQMPKFIGKELEIYGPFEPEDIANLPEDIAGILVKKGKAVRIEAN